jgi:heptose I phosphotransferase
MASTFWRRLRVGLWRVQQKRDWAALVAPGRTEGLMQLDLRDRFHAKQGRSIARWHLSAGRKELTVYLKRHYRGRWWQRLAALLGFRGVSDAWAEWDHLEWARRKGLPVPRAVAVGERIGPWCRLQSFLAVEELAGMVPLHEAIPAAAQSMAPRAFAAWKRGLVAELARLARRLHGQRRYHKDLYLCHFYVPKAYTRLAPLAWRGRVWMIDLHRLGHHPRNWRWWQVKDLAQIFYSSDVTGLTARDRLRFWHLYAGPNHDRGWNRWLRLAVSVRGWRYRRHNEARRAPARARRPAA